MAQLSHLYMTTGKTIALIICMFVGKAMSLLFNMLSRFVIAFLPRSKHVVDVVHSPRQVRLFVIPPTMDWSMSGFSIPHCLLEFAQVQVQWISDAIQLSYSQSPSASSSFPMSWLFTSCGQSIGASASASVLPKSNQGWFPLRLTSLISLLFKWLSRVFSSTKVQKHQFFTNRSSLLSSSHIPTQLQGRL